eukprot:10881042-Lingulodinium_polyedra.AAC.1
MASVIADLVEQQRQVAQYVISGCEVVKNQLRWAICADKAMVGGLPLQASLITTANGVGMVACPQ